MFAVGGTAVVVVLLLIVVYVWRLGSLSDANNIQLQQRIVALKKKLAAAEKTAMEKAAAAFLKLVDNTVNLALRWFVDVRIRSYCLFTYLETHRFGRQALSSLGAHFLAC